MRGGVGGRVARMAMPLLVSLASRGVSDAAPGDPVGTEFQVNTYTTGGQSNGVVASRGASGFVVVWRSDGSSGTDKSVFSIQGQRYDAAGATVGAQFQVNTYTTGFQGAPAVTSVSSGGFVVVWTSVSGSGTDATNSVQAQRFDAAGAPAGGQFQVNTYVTSSQDSAVVVPAGVGGFVVVWRSDGSTGTDADEASIQGQRYDAAGAPAGGEFQVNTYTTGLQGKPSAFGLADGGFVVAWQSYGSAASDTDDTSIQARRYDAAGTPSGNQFQVNSFTTSTQSFPAVGSDGSGGFVVTWDSDGSAGSDTSYTSVQARRFDDAAAPQGDAFQVNTYTTGDQYGYSVAPDGVGGFVVIWASYGGLSSDADARSIQARRFDADGAPVGVDFQVNSYMTGDQTVPSASPDGAGGFIVVWETEGGGGTDPGDSSIHAQRFAGGGAATTTTTPSTSTSTTSSSTSSSSSTSTTASTSTSTSTTTATSSSTSTSPTGTASTSTTSSVTTTSTTTSTPTTASTTTSTSTSTTTSTTSSTPTTTSTSTSTPPNGTTSSTTSVTAPTTASTSTSTSTTSTLSSTPTTTSTSTPVAATTTTTLAGEPLDGRKLQLTTKPGHPEKSELALVSKDRSLGIGRGNGSADDPVLHGGALGVSSTTGDFAATHQLAGGWKYAGKVGSQKGYKWKSRTSPIRAVVIKSGKLVISGKGSGLGFDLDDDPTPVRVELAVGEHRYCLVFGGATPRFKANKLYRATPAAAPAVCP